MKSLTGCNRTDYTAEYLKDRGTLVFDILLLSFVANYRRQDQRRLHLAIHNCP